MIGETFEVAASKAAGIKMKKLRVATDFRDPGLEFGEKIFSQPFRDRIILAEDFI